MNNTNRLISGDNKGHAAMLFEKQMDPDSLVGQSKFIAAFAQPHEGDVSPNTRGPRCQKTGLPCHTHESSCPGSDRCVASGPGKDMFESTRIIGEHQFLKALELYNTAEEALEGPVTYIHQNVNMTNQEVKRGNKTYHTCKPAMGFSFAAGTTDGPGAIQSIKQGDKTGSSWWNTLATIAQLNKATKEQIACQAPKPILVDSSTVSMFTSGGKTEWQPSLVETQVLRIGRLFVNAVPGEFTTMSGRRLLKAVHETLAVTNPKEKFEVLIAGLSNAYSDYVTTFEEYQVQRYEGASTIYGPHTLQAYIDQYKRLVKSLQTGKAVSAGPELTNHRKDSHVHQLPVYYDSHPWRMKYGDLHVDANTHYQPGDLVVVEFVSANPRNSPRLNHTFLTVEHEVRDNKYLSPSWEVVHTDTDWSTKFVWRRDRNRLTAPASSETTVYWKIPKDTEPGIYRIRHFGHYKYYRTIYPMQGKSRVFRIMPSTPTELTL